MIAAGKTVKIFTVGKKGRDQLKRDYSDMFVGHIDMSEVKRMSYSDAQTVARDILNRFDDNQFDVATLFYSRFQNVVTQIPTAQQIIPSKYRMGMRRRILFMITNQMKRLSWQTYCQEQFQRRFFRLFLRMVHLSKAHECLLWITQPEMLVR